MTDTTAAAAPAPVLFRTDREDLTPEEIAALTVLVLRRAAAARAAAGAPAPAQPLRRTVSWYDLSRRPAAPSRSWQVVA
ncbi:acyl-CoA carboxylase epsilon subunit [Kitasatospora sp. NPDC097643]|uniref:acyl-CoA carboxylase epsilon subunit n=1 Tax=Kitasatospora sp. NPDC097643 TaxID=3157230 RepID=UPI003329F4DC